MSQENQEAVHRVVGLWNGHDMEGVLALTDTEVEYVNSPTAVEPGTREGREALKSVFRDQWEMLADASWEIDRLYERGEEIVSLGRLSRRMPGSEGRIEDRVLVAFRFADARLTRLEIMGVGQVEVQAALEAAGLSE
jgi:ketosteroid isomerase-like protein